MDSSSAHAPWLSGDAASFLVPASWQSSADEFAAASRQQQLQQQSSDASYGAMANTGLGYTQVFGATPAPVPLAGGNNGGRDLDPLSFQLQLVSQMMGQLYGSAEEAAVATQMGGQLYGGEPAAASGYYADSGALLAEAQATPPAASWGSERGLQPAPMQLSFSGGGGGSLALTLQVAA